MLCRAADQDVIREVRVMAFPPRWVCPLALLTLTPLQGRASVPQQLHFLQQLLTLLPGSPRWSGARTDTEVLLQELCTSENLWQLLSPTLEPWPSHLRSVQSVGVLSSTSSSSTSSALSVSCYTSLRLDGTLEGS